MDEQQPIEQQPAEPQKVSAGGAVKKYLKWRLKIAIITIAVLVVIYIISLIF